LAILVAEALDLLAVICIAGIALMTPAVAQVPRQAVFAVMVLLLLVSNAMAAFEVQSLADLLVCGMAMCAVKIVNIILVIVLLLHL
jgi:hypothetical protein